MTSSIKSCIILTIIICTSVTGVLWQFSRGEFQQEKPKNTIEAWTRGYLREGSYVKINLQTIIGNQPKEPIKNVYVWVVDSNSTNMIGVMSQVGYGIWGGTVSYVGDLIIYSEESPIIYPFTVNIPLFKQYSKLTQDSDVTWKVVKDELGWDTRYFKFKKIVNGSTRQVQEWILDADTHMVKKIISTGIPDSPSKPGSKTIVTVTETSAGGRGQDELRMISSTAGLLSLIVGPLTVISILYNREKEGEETVKTERKRLKSEEYKEEYTKKYEEKRRRMWET